MDNQHERTDERSPPKWPDRRREPKRTEAERTGADRSRTRTGPEQNPKRTRAGPQVSRKNISIGVNVADARERTEGET